jgi:hypothetical protein
MPLPRPASPRALWNDLRAFARQRPRHQWLAAVLAVLIPIGIVVAFYFDAQTNIMPVRTIYYVESWPAARTDEEIKAKQKADLEARRAYEEERRREFQRIDDRLERLGI